MIWNLLSSSKKLKKFQVRVPILSSTFWLFWEWNWIQYNCIYRPGLSRRTRWRALHAVERKLPNSAHFKIALSAFCIRSYAMTLFEVLFFASSALVWVLLPLLYFKCPDFPQFCRLLYLAHRCGLHMALSIKFGFWPRPVCPWFWFPWDQWQEWCSRQCHSCDAGQGHARTFSIELEGSCTKQLSRQHTICVRCWGALA